MGFAISVVDVEDAAARIRESVKRTPVMTSRLVDEASGTACFFKCENLQRGGSFKIRGATNFVLQIPRDQLPKGVVAYSSGNHAQAVALAAKRLAIPATLVMPSDAPKVKLDSTRAQGAKIVTYDRSKEEREPIGRRIQEETGAVLIPPYDHPWTIAGQGTTALELLDEAPYLDALVAPIGGGGLLSGCAIAAKARNPAIRIFGVEPEGANDTALSFRKGERVKIPNPVSAADGLLAASPGELTFPILKALLEDVITVSEEEIWDAVLFLMTRMKLVVEPSGATPAAAVLRHKLPPEVRSVGIILSGGNVEPTALGRRG